MSSGRDADSRVFCSGVCSLAGAARVQCCTLFSARCSAPKEPLEGCLGWCCGSKISGRTACSGWRPWFLNKLEPRSLARSLPLSMVWYGQESKQANSIASLKGRKTSTGQAFLAIRHLSELFQASKLLYRSRLARNMRAISGAENFGSFAAC